MAKQKPYAPADDLLALINSTKPATPVLSSKEKTYFKGLKRRGYSEQQITGFIEKAGYKMTPDFFVVKKKEQLAAEKAARELKKKQVAAQAAR